jgi:hypothetical protein
MIFAAPFTELWLNRTSVGARDVTGRQVGERLAFAQVGRDEQGLLPGVQLPPQRPDRGPMIAAT